ncbi:hypothetical protein FKM82_012833 [Ascaphus truei]
MTYQFRQTRRMLWKTWILLFQLPTNSVWRNFSSLRIRKKM